MESNDFIQSVKNRLNITHFDEYQSGLIRIPVIYRRRYLLTLEYCPEPRAAYDLLYKGRLLPEENYKRFLQFISPKVLYA